MKHIQRKFLQTFLEQQILRSSKIKARKEKAKSQPIHQIRNFCSPEDITKRIKEKIFAYQYGTDM